MHTVNPFPFSKGGGAVFLTSTPLLPMLQKNRSWLCDQQVIHQKLGQGVETSFSGHVNSGHKVLL